MAISYANVGQRAPGLGDPLMLLSQLQGQQSQQVMDYFVQSQQRKKQDEYNKQMVTTEQAKADLANAEFQREGWTKQFDALNSRENFQYIKTWFDPAAAKARYQLGKNAGIIPATMTLDEYQSSIAPTDAELEEFAAGGKDWAKVRDERISTVEANKLKEQELNIEKAKVLLSEQDVMQNKADEEGKLELENRRLNWEMSKDSGVKAEEFDLIKDATDKSEAAAILKERAEIMQPYYISKKTGKKTLYDEKTRAKHKEAFKNRVDDYNKIATTWGLRPMKYDATDVKAGFPGRIGDYKDYDIGFGDLPKQPNRQQDGGEQVNNVSGETTETGKTWLDNGGKSYTEEEHKAIRKAAIAEASKGVVGDATALLNSLRPSN